MPIDRIKGEGDDLVDVELLDTTTDNIDGKKGLVTKSEICARITADRSSPITAEEVSAYARSRYGYCAKTSARMLAFNGTSFDMWTNNIEGTLLASAARTSTTVSTTQTNYNHKGIYLIMRVTSVTATPSVTMKLEIITAAGTFAFTATSGAITATGTYILALHPGLIDTAGTFHLACDALLPRSWRLYISHADADSITYSVEYALTV